MIDHTAEIEQLKDREAAIQTKLDKLNGHTDSHLEGVAKHFHLGMVGGSGRNTAKLNQRRERSMQRSIDNARECTALYGELNTVQAKIKDLEAGGPEQRAQKREERAKLLAEYWKRLKAGDTVNVGNVVTIKRKNAKSLTTEGGCNWTAAQIIGKEAAALL